MTTIAWDGTTLAADSLVVKETMCIYNHKKLFRAKDRSIIGGAGDPASVQAFINWYNGEHELLGGLEAEIILIKQSGEVRIYFNGPDYFVVGSPFIAIGSGEQFAMTALTLGYNAVNAVKTAMDLDSATGGQLATMTL